jgi:hypothetical protein
MDILFFGVLILGALAVGSFFALVVLALLIYVVKNIFPIVRRMALWAAKLENFLPLLALAVILLVLIILIALFAFRLPAIVSVLLILLLVVLLVLMVLVGILVVLAIIVYLIKLVVWLYMLWQGLFAGFLPQIGPQIARLKIKHEMGKGKDKDWTTHFAEMRSKLSGEADLARRRISKKRPSGSPQNIKRPKIKMSLKDKMLMPIMSNKSRKKKETETEQDHPPDSGSPP